LIVADFSSYFQNKLPLFGIPSTAAVVQNFSTTLVRHAEDAVKACIPYFDIHAKRGGKRGKAGEYPGFREEADIERWLMENLNDKMLNRKIRVIGRQVRIDVGIIDILLEDKESGEIIILEVKQGRAQPIVIEEQLHRYITSPDMIIRAKGKPILGCLVAEKIEKTVINSIKQSTHKITGYEINWKDKNIIDFKYIAGKW
jgi:RecB family endonuclease NucS